MTQLDGRMYAGFWRRLAACILDMVIVYGVVFALATAAAAISAAGDGGVLGALIVVLAIFPGMWLYFALQECSAAQATLGKRVLNIKVVDEAGERIGFGRATGRFFAKFLSSMLFYAGFIMIAFTRAKRGLHDMAASTLVVDRSADSAEVEASFSDLPRSNAGLIVLVVVVVAMIPTIGIMAAVAIPAYQDYTIRSQVAQGLSVATQVKSAVAQYRRNTGKWPQDSSQLDLADLEQGQYVEEIRVSDGTITIVYGGVANSQIGGQALSLQPGLSQTGAVFWRCGRGAVDERVVSDAGEEEIENSASAQDADSDTTIPDKYLPAMCRAPQ